MVPAACDGLCPFVSDTVAVSTSPCATTVIIATMSTPLVTGSRHMPPACHDLGTMRAEQTKRALHTTASPCCEGDPRVETPTCRTADRVPDDMGRHMRVVAMLVVLLLAVAVPAVQSKSVRESVLPSP